MEALATIDTQDNIAVALSQRLPACSYAIVYSRSPDVVQWDRTARSHRSPRLHEKLEFMFRCEERWCTRTGSDACKNTPQLGARSANWKGGSPAYHIPPRAGLYSELGAIGFPSSSTAGEIVNAASVLAMTMNRKLSAR